MPRGPDRIAQPRGGAVGARPEGSGEWGAGVSGGGGSERLACNACGSFRWGSLLAGILLPSAWLCEGLQTSMSSSFPPPRPPVALPALLNLPCVLAASLCFSAPPLAPLHSCTCFIGEAPSSGLPLTVTSPASTPWPFGRSDVYRQRPSPAWLTKARVRLFIRVKNCVHFMDPI